MPRDSAFIRSVDPDGWQWGPTEQLLASVLEQHSVTQIQLFKGFRFKGRPPKPLDIARPGKRPKKQTVITPREFARMVASM